MDRMNRFPQGTQESLCDAGPYAAYIGDDGVRAVRSGFMVAAERYGFRMRDINPTGPALAGWYLKSREERMPGALPAGGFHEPSDVVDFFRAVPLSRKDVMGADFVPPDACPAYWEYADLLQEAGSGQPGVAGHPGRACRVAVMEAHRAGHGGWSVKLTQACDIPGSRYTLGGPYLSYYGENGMPAPVMYTDREYKVMMGAANKDGDRPVFYADLVPVAEHGSVSAKVDTRSLRASAIGFDQASHDQAVREAEGEGPYAAQGEKHGKARAGMFVYKGEALGPGIPASPAPAQMDMGY